ncbi:HlyD family secretion protein [Pseudanabaena sp. PCC 6802]|uniref:HlyD family secretion protein n=1 Tax=Pseudanabaena sp. PCC 6802 TaxID=118173 RepID=UPI00034B6FB1|nr:HlyD family efflux transporter periplasmic adaptor subunit [Pseudanabaena sp. PCC 6802]
MSLDTMSPGPLETATKPAPSPDLDSGLEIPSQRKSPPRLLIPLGILAIAGAGFAAWSLLKPPADRGLHASGRLEGYETDVAAKTGGRISFIAVREGDKVKQGQVLVRIDDSEVQAQLRGAKAQVASAQDSVQQVFWQINTIENQIRASQLNVSQSQQDAQGRSLQAQANVAATEAQLQQSLAQLKLAKQDRDRYAQLVKEGAVTSQRFDQAQTTYESALATVAANQKQVNAAKGALTLAESSQYNPSIQSAQLDALLSQQKQVNAQLKAAQSNVKNALANQQLIEAQIAYLTIASPIDGVVTARTREPGAVVTNGQTVLTLVDLNSVYLRAYVPQGDIGRVRVGQTARVFLDSDPQRPLAAKVAAIDAEASFTPENIYFQKDRVKQVFGIKITIDNPGGFAKPGMPADAEIQLN